MMVILKYIITLNYHGWTKLVLFHELFHKEPSPIPDLLPLTYNGNET